MAYTSISVLEVEHRDIIPFLEVTRSSPFIDIDYLPPPPLPMLAALCVAELEVRAKALLRL